MLFRSKQTFRRGLSFGFSLARPLPCHSNMKWPRGERMPLLSCASLLQMGHSCVQGSLEQRCSQRIKPTFRLLSGESRRAHRNSWPLRRKLQRKAQGWLRRSEEHTSELQSLMRISYAVFCLKKKKEI